MGSIWLASTFGALLQLPWALCILFLSRSFSLDPFDVESFLLKKTEHHQENSEPNKIIRNISCCSKSLSIFSVTHNDLCVFLLQHLDYPSVFYIRFAYSKSHVKILSQIFLQRISDLSIVLNQIIIKQSLPWQSAIERAWITLCISALKELNIILRISKIILVYLNLNFISRNVGLCAEKQSKKNRYELSLKRKGILWYKISRKVDFILLYSPTNSKILNPFAVDWITCAQYVTRDVDRETLITPPDFLLIGDEKLFFVRVLYML